MAKLYKLCDCGHMNIFDETEIEPRTCPECTRSLLRKDIFSLDEYEKRKMQEEAEKEETVTEEEDKTSESGAILKLVNDEKNIEIILPAHEDFVIGREAYGKGVFGSTISRNHLYCSPVGTIGLRVVDKDSLNGTKINGEIIPKGKPKILGIGDELTLDINSGGISLKLKRME